MARKRSKELDGYYFTDKELAQRAQAAVVNSIKSTVSTASLLTAFTPQQQQEVMELMALGKVLMTAKSPTELERGFSSISWDKLKMSDAADLLLGSCNADAIGLAPIAWETVEEVPTEEEERYHYRNNHFYSGDHFLVPPYESSWVVKNCIQKYRQDIFHWSATNHKVSDIPYKAKTLMVDTLIGQQKITGSQSIDSECLETIKRPVRLIDLAIVHSSHADHLERIFASSAWTKPEEVEDTIMALAVALRTNVFRDEKSNIHFKIASQILKNDFNWERTFRVRPDLKSEDFPLAMIVLNVVSGIHLDEDSKKIKQISQLLRDSALGYVLNLDDKAKEKFVKSFLTMFEQTHEDDVFWATCCNQHVKLKWVGEEVMTSLMKDKAMAPIVIEHLFHNFLKQVGSFYRYEVPNINLSAVPQQAVWGNDKVKQIYQALTDSDKKKFKEQDWKHLGKEWKKMAPLFDHNSRIAFEDLCDVLIKKNVDLDGLRLMLDVFNNDIQKGLTRPARAPKKI